jgi:hypothetical protein
MRLGKTRGLLAVLMLALVGFLPSQAFAQPTNAVYFAVDGSGSISSADYALQINGYVNAFNDILPAFYGDVAVGVAIFGADVHEIFAIQEINNATDLNLLTGALSATIPGRDGINQSFTAIGNAIADASAAIQGSFSGSSNRVIDVSTDGQNNIGANPTTAANDADALGITTNCLGVGGSADCSFATGFDVAAADFGDFEAALRDKLQRELPVPEPGTLILMGIGLAGLGFARRRAHA